MGYNTTVVIMNDALDSIANDSDFGRRLADEIKRSSFRPDTPNDVSAAGFCNAALIIESHHSSEEVTVVVGRNSGRVQVPDEIHRALAEGYEAGREAERRRQLAPSGSNAKRESQRAVTAGSSTGNQSGLAGPSGLAPSPSGGASSEARRVEIERTHVGYRIHLRDVWGEAAHVNSEEAHALFEALGEHLGREFGAQSAQPEPCPNDACTGTSRCAGMHDGQCYGSSGKDLKYRQRADNLRPSWVLRNQGYVALQSGDIVTPEDHAEGPMFVGVVTGVMPSSVANPYRVEWCTGVEGFGLRRDQLVLVHRPRSRSETAGPELTDLRRVFRAARELIADPESEARRMELAVVVKMAAETGSAGT